MRTELKHPALQRHMLTVLVTALLGWTAVACSGFEDGLEGAAEAPSSETTSEDPSSESPSLEETPSPAETPADTTTETATETPTEPPESEEPEAEPVMVDPKELLVARDEEGPGNWQADDPSPGDAEHTTNQACLDLSQGQYSDSGGAELAVASWSDYSTPNVMNSDQVVRVFPSEAEAEDWMKALRAGLSKCREYKSGPTDPPKIITRTTFYRLPVRYGDQMIAWREQADFGVGATASTWHITARYANVVSTVDATALDDVQNLSIRDVRTYATQAQRLILATIKDTQG